MREREEEHLEKEKTEKKSIAYTVVLFKRSTSIHNYFTDP
jgi:hypothetical protein